MIISFADDKYCALYHNEGMRLIEDANNMAKKRTEDARILNALKSLKNLWETKNFYSEISYSPEAYYGELLTILENGLRFFYDKRRKNITFAVCEEKLGETVKQLKKYILDEKEVENIRKINKRKRERSNYKRVMTFQDFSENLDCDIKEYKILSKYNYKDKYKVECYKKRVKRYQGIQDVVQEIGGSDSYMAQIIYEELMNELARSCGASSYKLSSLLKLYRCVVKESTASEKELWLEYSPCI